MALLPKSATSEKLKSQCYMEVDPEECNSELLLVYDHYKSRLDHFQQQAALYYPSLFTGISAAKELGDRTIFLTHVTPFYPNRLARFPTELLNFLESSARILPGVLRLQLVQALACLINWKMIGLAEALQVFMELQTLGDRVIQQMAFSQVIQSITLMNQEHRNNPKNEAVQNILFEMLQQEDEAKTMRVLITLCELHRQKVWSDKRTADAICTACFHPSSRIMIAALSFLLDGGGDDSNSEDDQATPQPQIVLNKEAMHKASRKGTTSSKKKKAKLQQQQHLSSEKSDTGYSSPLNHLKDAQGFSEKLFSRLQSSSNEMFEVKIMMLKVIARTVGLHHLILLDFYPYLQKYVELHKQDVTALLAAAVEACHEMVPPDAVKPLFKQIVNQFVHDGSRPEDITVGLNVVRKMCLRMPLLMTKELLQNLVLYRKSHEKAVSASARLLLTLFREICPSLLVKKDRGQPAELIAKPKAFGEVHVPSNKSKEKKRKLSDLDAANLSLAALKNLLNEALVPHTLVSRGIATLGPLNDFRWNPWVDRPRFLRRNSIAEVNKGTVIGSQKSTKGNHQETILLRIEFRIVRENDESKAKIATTHQEKKKRKHSCKQFRGRKA
ncbi:hypothetical protein OROHE_022392 [Orobanche hederae]